MGMPSSRKEQAVGHTKLGDAKTRRDKKVGLSSQNWKHGTNLLLAVEDCTKRRGQREKSSGDASDRQQRRWERDVSNPERIRRRSGNGKQWVGQHITT